MKAFVDRIEAGIATLLIGEQKSNRVNIPIELLPEGTREGMVVQISAEIDVESTDKAKDDIRALRDSLLNGS